MSTNNIAFTAQLNPTGATPILTQEQVWTGLLLKIRSAETFVPNAIQSTTVVSESIDPSTENPVTVRDVVFRENERQVREVVTAYKPSRVAFVQPDGSTINNLVSEDANGDLYMTYTFEWRHPGASSAELAGFLEKEKNMSKMAVNGTIAVLRQLAKDGKI
ncbi:hypothetical protein N7466_009798 [Penicillium verhagenii]|uniref:uncharacterized protein n=1 Tax=Penicillium verhagenii TaxID=1562060 RepID=UPI0025457458|nr:uncharacterized protein N7466_009798 [Penicillium verhagenii]KAJ5921472.1 hypothetical protein N7466_009798 [Penicillium verhagenii]